MSHSRMPAAVAALLLVGACVFGGAVAAYAGPADAPVITNPVTGADPDGQPQVEGDVAENGLTVTVQVTNSIGTYTYCTDPGADIALGFSCVGGELPFGVSTFTATSTYTSGSPDTLPSPVSNEVVYTRWDPSTPVAMTAGPPVSSPDATPTFSGTGPALGSVHLWETDVVGDEVCEASVEADGTWSCTLSPLSAGSYSVSVVEATFYSGAPAPISDGGPIDFDVASPPAPTVTQSFSPWMTTGEAVAVEGTKDVDVSDIAVWRSTTGVDGWVPYCTTSAGIGATNWFCSEPTGTLALGTNYLAAIASSEGGSASIFGSQAVVERLQETVLLTPANGEYTNDSTPTFTGQAFSEPGTVTVWEPPEEGIYCTSPIDDSAFSCESYELTDGTYEWFVEAPSGSGLTTETRTFTVDTVVANAVITEPEDGGIISTLDPVVAGNSEPFSAIEVYQDGEPATCAEGAVFADSDGLWSCTLSEPLPQGSDYTFATVQTDRAGNVSNGGVPAGDVSVTAVGPPQPTTIDALGDEDGYVYSDTVEVTGTSGNLGATLYVSGGGEDCEALVVDGVWSCSLTIGTAQDVAISVRESFEGTVVDTAVVSLLGPVGLNGLDEGGVLYRSDSSPTISGDAEEESEAGVNTVTVTLTSEAVPGDFECTTTTSEGGSESELLAVGWSCTFEGPVPAGEYDLSAVQAPAWAGGRTSLPTEATLIITLAGLDGVECSFGPGSIGVRGDSGTTVSLYQVAPGAPDYTTGELGACSGSAGAAGPIEWNDVYRGDCGNPEVGADPWLAGDITTDCGATGLTPGVWNLYYSTTGDGEGGTYYDWFFIVPESPGLAAGVGAPGIAVFSGTGVPGDSVAVRGGADETVCTSVVGAGGAWSCSAYLPGTSATYRAVETDASSGGMSPYSAAVALTVPAIPAPPVDPEPTPTATPGPTPTPTPTVKPPLVWQLVITGLDGPLKPGQRIGLSSSGLPAGSVVDAELHSTPVALGSTTVKADGTFSMNVTIPMDVEAGAHEIVVAVTPPGESPSVVQNGVTVELDEKVAAEPDRADVLAQLAAADGGSSRSEPAAPSAITEAIPTLRDIVGSPVTLALASGLALLILLLVAVPTEMLNSTLESNTGRFGRAFDAVQSRVDQATSWFSRVTRTPIVAAAILILLTSITFGFVDPAFGFDIVSLRLVLSLALALFVLTVIIPSITGVIVHRAWGVESTIGMQPIALLFAIVGVVLARLLDFAPGFLVGLVVGLELAERASRRVRVRATVIELSSIIVVAVLAWIAYSLIADAPAGDPGFGSALLQDTLVAITSEGLTAVLVVLIPVGFLDGRALFQRAKRLWALLFVAAGFAFSLIVLPTALQVREMANIGWWIAVLIGYAVVTFALTFALRATSRDDDDEDAGPGTSHEQEPARDSVA